jgi:hypothetical protein
MDRLHDILERVLVNQHPGRRDSFKIPEYDGQTDICYFLRQFQDITTASDWNPAASLLQLREALRGKAQECGNADSVEGVFEALQAKFGLSVREARNKITLLRRESKITLQEYGTEVSKLMNITYPELPVDHKQRLVLDTFQNTLNNTYLQRHLLAINPRTLEDAIRAGNDFLQIKNTNFPGSQIRAVEEGENVSIPEVQTIQTNPLDSLMKMMQQLTAEVSSIKETQRNIQAKRETRRIENNKNENQRQINNGHFTNKPPACWGCGQPGHTKRECNSNPWNTQRPFPGNGSGPQQW